MVELFWKSDITNKSFTKYINVDVLKVGASHHAWSTVRNNVHDSRRVQIKCRLLIAGQSFSFFLSPFTS